MTKKEMLDTLLDEYFNKRYSCDVMKDYERELREGGSITQADHACILRHNIAQDCVTYEHIIMILFGIDAFDMWINS